MKVDDVVVPNRLYDEEDKVEDDRTAIDLAMVILVGEADPTTDDDVVPRAMILRKIP